MTTLRFALVAMLLSSATVSPALAQGAGVVSGTVSDETGGVLPGVSMTLQPAGAAALETVTDDQGRYRFENVPAGPAEITFRLINFSTVPPADHRDGRRHRDGQRRDAGRRRAPTS